MADPTPLLYEAATARTLAMSVRKWKAATAALAVTTVTLLVLLVALHSGHGLAAATTLSVMGAEVGSPPPPGARFFPPSPPVPSFYPTDGTHDVAYVVFTRHGERGIDKDDKDLTPEGYVRAAYMNKCIDRAPTVAFPLGAPTRMLASLRDDSNRPNETLYAISTKLGVALEYADMMDIYAVNRLVPSLQPGDQLLVSWQHWFMPKIIAALYPPTPWLLRGFPSTCHTDLYEEPQYTRETNGGDCYDIVWQVVLTRPKARPQDAWQAVTFNQMHMGFGGAADSPCAEAFATIDVSCAMVKP